MHNTDNIEYWNITSLANKVSMDANNTRAGKEHERILQGEYLEQVHSEALRDFKDIERIILGGIAFSKNLGLDYAGDAADLGSGVGTGAAIISKLTEIQTIYAVEFSEQFVKNLMPGALAAYIADTSKIRRVVGDFNQLELPDESLSLIVEVDAFHHSEDLDVTLRECYRVLKPGGVIIAQDRAWPDSTSREELESMLDKEYSVKQKALWGVPAEQTYRRRDNGEHEYTIRDWLEAFKRNGFDGNVFSQIHPPALNRIFTRIPTFSFTILLSSWMYHLGRRRHRVYGFNPTKKLFVCIKK